MKFTLKMLLQILWLFVAAVLGLVLCIVMFKHPNVDHLFARVYSWGALRLAGLRVQIQGAHYLKAVRGKTVVYVANHQSGLDMMTFGKIYPRRTVVIGKKELLYIPLFGFFYWAAGNILINRQRSAQAVKELQRVTGLMRARKISAWIFPEGTRNSGHVDLLPFKKGAFHMAIAGGFPIVPIVSAPLGQMVSWKKKQFESGKIPIRVLPPIATETLDVEDLPELMERVRGAMVSAVGELEAEPGRKRKERSALPKTVALGAFLTSWVSGCSSPPKDLHWTAQLYPSTLMVRRTPHAPARPKAMGGEKEYQSDPLPNAQYDCEPIEAMWKGMNLRAIRECLSTVNTTKERLSVNYRLVRDPAPYLQPEDPETAPACLKEVLPKIPVPREIFFQGQMSDSAGGMLTCFNSRINLEDDELWGWKLPIGKLDLELVFPMMELPSNDAETRMLLQAWGLRLLRDQDHQLKFPVKVVPDFLCRRCLGRDRWLEPHNPLPALWP